MRMVTRPLICLKICPCAQRTMIALREKAMPAVFTYLDPDPRPARFRALSPLGKSPLLRVGGAVRLEPVAMREYLDEVRSWDPLRRARHRVWIEFATGITRLAAYRGALPAHTSVTDSGVPEFTELFMQYFRGKAGHVAGRLPTTIGATH